MAADLFKAGRANKWLEADIRKLQEKMQTQRNDNARDETRLKELIDELHNKLHAANATNIAIQDERLKMLQRSVGKWYVGK